MKIILVMAFLIGMSNFSYSQYSFQSFSDIKTGITKKDESKNSLKKGMWAIQFGINSNFTLTAFDGAALSVKRQFNKNLGFRLSVSGNYNKRTDDTSEAYSDKSQSFGFNLSAMYYINPKNKFNVYGLLGFQFNHSYRYYSNTENFDENKRTSYGPSLGIGAEYFIHKQFSVFAEYNYTFQFGNEKSSYGYFFPFEKNEQSNSFVDLRSDYVKFGASVYFRL